MSIFSGRASSIISDSPSTLIFTPAATTEPISTATQSDAVPRTRVSRPKAGSTFIIQSVKDKKVIAFWKGLVSLVEWDKPNTTIITRWECVERGGWFGFRDPVSYQFLGCDYDALVCRNTTQNNNESFQVMERKEREYELLIPSIKSSNLVGLRPVAIGSPPAGLKVVNKSSEATVWRFIEL
ncbi:hypothetical protein DM02DRAFT_689392 [Periconia macrospinosa]|uniref:Uncharacterized protein n=1 Tax=Periconia macrospinosa TaxID=97972 RepID=A0A2V1DCA3_9PLEO|nr:hypothetical protein DM02DRAFT_689392 [Periconia macrospinosa]